MKSCCEICGIKMFSGQFDRLCFTSTVFYIRIRVCALLSRCGHSLYIHVLHNLQGVYVCVCAFLMTVAINYVLFTFEDENSWKSREYCKVSGNALFFFFCRERFLISVCLGGAGVSRGVSLA